jgi:hypothetical protein
MPDARLTRRLAGMLRSRISEARLDLVPDRRDPRGLRWDLDTLLVATLCGLVAGATSLAGAERISDTLSRAARRWLGIRRRVPDTTLRDALCTLDPRHLAPRLHAVVLAAERRKAIGSDWLPFGVVSLDGKSFCLPSCDDRYAQRQTQGEDGHLVGAVRSITATLTSSRARPIIDVTPVPASTNEMGWFRFALGHLCEAYGHRDLFRLVTYDAGACSLDNANAVRERKLHYLLGLKGTQPTLLQGARLWLGALPPERADAHTEDHPNAKTTVIRRIWLGEATDAPEGWDHLRTVIRVESVKVDEHGKEGKPEERYFLSSLPRDRLCAQHWLRIIRSHWGVETSHQILDVSLLEDRHPWIEANPRAAFAVSVLRRIAYTMLTLFRSVTQRSDEKRRGPWKDLLEDIRLTLATLAPDHLLGIRIRPHLPALC